MPPREPEPNRDRGIQMRAGHVPDRVNHRQHHQPKSQSHAHMTDPAAGDVIDHDRAGSGEH